MDDASDSATPRFSGDRVALSRAITAVANDRPDAKRHLQAIYRCPGNAPGDWLYWAPGAANRH